MLLSACTAPAIACSVTFALEQWQFSGKLKKNQTLVTQTVCMVESASQQGRLSAAPRAERQKEKTGFGDRFLKQRCSVKMVCRAETKLCNNRVQRTGWEVIVLPAMSATSQGDNVVVGSYLSLCKYPDGEEALEEKLQPAELPFGCLA